MDETSPRLLTFNVHYGLFRILLTMFGLLALASLTGLTRALVRSPSHLLPFGLWSTVFTLAAAIAYSRCKKRSEDFAQSVYDLLLAYATGIDRNSARRSAQSRPSSS